MGALICYFKNSNETDSKIFNAEKEEFLVDVSPTQVGKTFFENKRSQGFKSDQKLFHLEKELKVQNHNFYVFQQG